MQGTALTASLLYFKSYEAMISMRLSTDVFQGKRNHAEQKVLSVSVHHRDETLGVCRDYASVRNQSWHSIVIKR